MAPRAPHCPRHRGGPMFAAELSINRSFWMVALPGAGPTWWRPTNGQDVTTSQTGEAEPGTALSLRPPSSAPPAPARDRSPRSLPGSAPGPADCRQANHCPSGDTQKDRSPAASLIRGSPERRSQVPLRDSTAKKGPGRPPQHTWLSVSPSLGNAGCKGGFIKTKIGGKKKMGEETLNSFSRSDKGTV